MNKELSEFLKKEYPDSKSDLFAAFMDIDHYTKENGFYAAINQHSWMFLSSYEKLRKKIIKNKFIDTMLHLGPRAFEEIGGEVVQTTAFVLRNTDYEMAKGKYLRLIEERTASEKRDKAIAAVKNPTESYCYGAVQKEFKKIPGSPIAYWTSKKVIEIFKKNMKVNDLAEIKVGLQTGDNNRFLRLWHEVEWNKIGFNYSNSNEALLSKKKWFPYNKGGNYRKWYGNQEYVVNWETDGVEIKNFVDDKGKQRSRPQNASYYFKEGITWSFVSSSHFGVRYSPTGFVFDVGGSSLFPSAKDIKFLTGLLTSKLAFFFLSNTNPTLNFQVGNVGSIPLPSMEQDNDKLNELVTDSIAIARKDWDSFETSWNYLKHPLIGCPFTKLKSAFSYWEQVAKTRFNHLKSNEEEINRVFIEYYELQDELRPEVDDNEVTLSKADMVRDIKSLISYAIGCSFGRYSLDGEGLIYAGGEFDFSRYKTFPADKDNILPLLSGAYFEDDIVSNFINFVRVSFGEENFSENLEFIADALGRKKEETAKETLRRYFINDFYKDHVRIYNSRPIYWLFTSGKEKVFNCLIYMHRYNKTTLSRIRTDYLHDYQIRLDAEKKDLLNIIEGDSTAKEVSNAKKELKSLEKKIDELKAYDELLHHMADQQIEIDLDDGVKVNYEKFKGLVAKI